jgi:hypothetical protein
VYGDLLNRRIVDSTNIRNLNDLRLLQVGLVYEINFSPTHRRILERDNMGQIQRCLSPSERDNEVCAAAGQYVASQVDQELDHLTAREGVRR